MAAAIENHAKRVNDERSEVGFFFVGIKLCYLIKIISSLSLCLNQLICGDPDREAIIDSLATLVGLHASPEETPTLMLVQAFLFKFFNEASG